MRNPRQQVLVEQHEVGIFHSHNSDVDEGSGFSALMIIIVFSKFLFDAVNREWKTVGRHKWKQSATLPVYEARASLFAVRHVLRPRSELVWKEALDTY